MVSVSLLLTAAIVGLIAPATCAPLTRCDWTGCKYELNDSKFVNQASDVQASGTLGTFKASPSEIAAALGKLTQKSLSLQPVATSINMVNGPLVIAGQGPYPEVVRGFIDIINEGSTALIQFQDSAPITSSGDADTVFDAYRDFARVHQQLITILTGKASLFPTAPFILQPVVSVLRQDEGLLDGLTFTLVDLVSGKTSDFETVGQSLTTTVATAIAAHQGGI